MPNTTTRLTSDALEFLTERHLAMLTTLRADGSPHVVAVGFTFDPRTHIARVITSDGSQKAVNADRSNIGVLSQVDGARWLALGGVATAGTMSRSYFYPAQRMQRKQLAAHFPRIRSQRIIAI